VKPATFDVTDEHGALTQGRAGVATPTVSDAAAVPGRSRQRSHKRIAIGRLRTLAG
jgi:hypothetical protein